MSTDESNLTGLAFFKTDKSSSYVWSGKINSGAKLVLRISLVRGELVRAGTVEHLVARFHGGLGTPKKPWEFFDPSHSVFSPD